MTRKMRPFVVLLPRLCSKKPGGKVGQYCRSIKQNEAIKYSTYAAAVNHPRFFQSLFGIEIVSGMVATSEYIHGIYYIG